MTGDNVLLLNWYPLGVKNISRHVHKTESWDLWGSFQNFRRAPLSFLCGHHPRGRAAEGIYGGIQLINQFQERQERFT